MKYTYLDLSVETLLRIGRGAAPNQIWEKAVEYGLDDKLRFRRTLTPWDNVRTTIYTDMSTKGDASFFQKVQGSSPVEFSLRNEVEARAHLDGIRNAPNSENSQDEGNDEYKDDSGAAGLGEQASPQRRFGYVERELHPWLVRFAKYGLGGVFTKTIYHEKSTRGSYAEWIHPDVVGFWFPFEEYTEEVRKLSQTGLGLVHFYSFEMKRELDKKNLRESFFQAVSNSSWSNEGYLVAANIDERPDFRKELERLSESFGIGVIELDLENPDASQIIFQARYREAVDWAGANKLAKENPEFRKFLSDVHKDVTTCRSFDSSYDSCSTTDELRDLLRSFATPR